MGQLASIGIYDLQMLWSEGTRLWPQKAQFAVCAHLLGLTILVGGIDVDCEGRNGWLGVAVCWDCILKAFPCPYERRCNNSCTSWGPKTVSLLKGTAVTWTCPSSSCLKSKPLTLNTCFSCLHIDMRLSVQAQLHVLNTLRVH